MRQQGSPVRIVIVGYGVQGRKRHRVAGGAAAGIIDPIAPEADWRDITQVPLDCYDAAIVCTPDQPKMSVLRHLAAHGKHALVEKPLHGGRDQDLRDLETLARRAGAVCTTAYNHRFEPHFVRMRDLIRSGVLGRIYRCRMSYGNGTARLVRNSPWRDAGSGVLADLGSHLLDTVRFWFGDVGDDFRLVTASRFENRAPDHVLVVNAGAQPQLALEMTLCSWRNHFTCDVLAEHGSAHIDSLCKWGPATFVHRVRVLPSGPPREETRTLIQDDPTWALEFAHFQQLCAAGGPTDLANDLWLHRVLGRLAADVRAVMEAA